MALAFLGCVAALVGCGPIRPPELPAPIETPTAEVRSVRLVETSEEASRYRIELTVSNPNGIALPMTHALYRLRVGEREYRGDYVPSTTLPAEGRIEVSLPAVLSGSRPVGRTYEASGSIELMPPGEVRRLIYELGMPPPRVSFEGGGPLASSSGASTDSESEPGP